MQEPRLSEVEIWVQENLQGNSRYGVVWMHEGSVSGQEATGMC